MRWATLRLVHTGKYIAMVVLPALLLGLGACTGKVVTSASATHTPFHPLKGSPAPHAEILPPTSLHAPESHPLVGFDFEPPGSATPKISADRAIAIANRGDAPPAESEQAILAIVPAGGTFPHNTLVWLVRFEGACVSVHGQPIPDATPGNTISGVECGRRQDVIVDATTGRDFGSYFD